jgi:DNA-directed RNA polymerase II subunit RPB7
VTSIENFGNGRILEGSGMAEFTVKYKAIVYKPFKGEVVEARITVVNKVYLSLTIIQLSTVYVLLFTDGILC